MVVDAKGAIRCCIIVYRHRLSQSVSQSSVIAIDDNRSLLLVIHTPQKVAVGDSDDNDANPDDERQARTDRRTSRSAEDRIGQDGWHGTGAAEQQPKSNTSVESQPKARNTIPSAVAAISPESGEVLLVKSSSQTHTTRRRFNDVQDECDEDKKKVLQEEATAKPERSESEFRTVRRTYRTVCSGDREILLEELPQPRVSLLFSLLVRESSVTKQ